MAPRSIKNRNPASNQPEAETNKVHHDILARGAFGLRAVDVNDANSVSGEPRKKRQPEKRPSLFCPLDRPCGCVYIVCRSSVPILHRQCRDLGQLEKEKRIIIYMYKQQLKQPSRPRSHSSSRPVRRRRIARVWNRFLDRIAGNGGETLHFPACIRPC